jgi:exonuclease VII small subunit
MSISVFLSTVTDEFGAYRVKLEGDLTRHDVAVKVQERFKDLGGDTLDKLDTYVAHCDAVVHLVGEMCGAAADAGQQEALVAKYPDLPRRLPPLGGALVDGAAIPHTQWEAWLALYHKKPLMIAKAATAAPRGPKYAPTDGSRASQAAHLARLKAFHRYPGCEFQNPDDLAKHIAYSAILDLLVKDYAEKTARERDVAQGFIKEMAERVAGDKALDFDGMKQAVENAIEIYEKEIAGRPVETNLDDIVGRALARAKEQVDRGQSRVALATLRKAADESRRAEQEHRDRYVAGQTLLRNQERDIALASYDGDAAAEAIVALAEAIYGANAPAVETFVTSEADTLQTYGRDRGSKVHLVAVIALRRRLLAHASTEDERGASRTNLGNALLTLGGRESGTARLEEAVAAYRAALEERTRERVPLNWATTLNNLGSTLQALGYRESGTAPLEEAVEAYRAALEEHTRERVPLQWAYTQHGLASALAAVAKRQRNAALMEEALTAMRGAVDAYQKAGEGYWLPIAQRRLAEMEAELAEMKARTKDGE